MSCKDFSRKREWVSSSPSPRFEVPNLLFSYIGHYTKVKNPEILSAFTALIHSPKENIYRSRSLFILQLVSGHTHLPGRLVNPYHRRLLNQQSACGLYCNYAKHTLVTAYRRECIIWCYLKKKNKIKGQHAQTLGHDVMWFRASTTTGCFRLAISFTKLWLTKHLLIY